MCGRSRATYSAGSRAPFSTADGAFVCVLGRRLRLTLDSITVRHYESGWQGGAIQPDARATGWVVRNVTAVQNSWAGLLASDDMKILGGHYNDNDQMVSAETRLTGILLDGLDDDPVTMDGPEMAYNHTLHAPCDFEGGGMKWDVGRVVVRNAHVHDNDLRGLWADINTHDALIEHNLVEDNHAEGIYYEISRNGVIRNNRVFRNVRGLRLERTAASRWPPVPTSTATATASPATTTGSPEPSRTGPTRPRPAHLLDGYHVHDNLICATREGGLPTGVTADDGADLATRDITFTGNTIQSAACE